VSILVALTVGLVFWMSAWALGWKAFDAFLVTIALVLMATVVRVATPFVNQLLGRETAAESQTPEGL
jgi:hypothetical protein